MCSTSARFATVYVRFCRKKRSWNVFFSSCFELCFTKNLKPGSYVRGDVNSNKKRTAWTRKVLPLALPIFLPRRRRVHIVQEQMVTNELVARAHLTVRHYRAWSWLFHNKIKTLWTLRKEYSENPMCCSKSNDRKGLLRERWSFKSQRCAVYVPALVCYGIPMRSILDATKYCTVFD